MRRRDFLGLSAGVGAWPFAGQGQQWAKVFRITFVISSGSVSELRARTTRGYPAFLDEMRKLGYVEGQSLIVQLFSGEGNEERYAVLARDLIQLQPDVIFAVGVPMVPHFKSATTIIPIVAVMSDPVAYGIVSNLSRPTGNITGVSLDAGLENWGKRIELLKEANPGLRRVSFLATRGVGIDWWSDNPSSPEYGLFPPERIARWSSARERISPLVCIYATRAGTGGADQ